MFLAERALHRPDAAKGGYDLIGGGGRDSGLHGRYLYTSRFVLSKSLMQYLYNTRRTMAPP